MKTLVRIAIFMGAKDALQLVEDVQITLEGGEFSVCQISGQVFCASNRWACSLSTSLLTKELKIKWLSPYNLAPKAFPLQRSLVLDQDYT